MATIGTTPTGLGTQAMLVQNLGTGILYVGGSDVSAANGVRIGPGEALAVDPTNAPGVWVVSDTTADVRTLTRGTSISTFTNA